MVAPVGTKASYPSTNQVSLSMNPSLSRENERHFSSQNRGCEGGGANAFICCLAPPDLNTLTCPLALQAPEFTVKKIDNCQTAIQSHSSFGVRAFVTQLFSLNASRSSSSSFELAAFQGRIYTLNQPKMLFRRMCADPGVRDWLEEQIGDGSTVYFVIGFETLIDAQVGGGGVTGTTQTLGAEIPVSVAAGLPTVHQLDIGIQGERERHQAVRHVYLAPGENVYSIRVQKVRFNFSKTVDNTRLAAGDSWLVLSDNRGEDEIEEYVTAELDSEDDTESLDGVHLDDGSDRGPIYLSIGEDGL